MRIRRKLNYSFHIAQYASIINDYNNISIINNHHFTQAKPIRKSKLTFSLFMKPIKLLFSLNLK